MTARPRCYESPNIMYEMTWVCANGIIHQISKTIVGNII